MRAVIADHSGQDMIEYALLAAAGVVALIAVLPTYIVAPISSIFSSVTSLLVKFGG